MWANPNVMVALLNIGDTLCSSWTPQSLADTHYYRVPCSNAAKTRNRLKFAGVSQTGKPISAVSRPKFAILWGHVEEILQFKIFFRLSIVLYLRRYGPTKLCYGAQIAIFGDFFCVLHFQGSECSTFQTCILNSHQGHTMCGSRLW